MIAEGYVVSLEGEKRHPFFETFSEAETYANILMEKGHRYSEIMVSKIVYMKE